MLTGSGSLSTSTDNAPYDLDRAPTLIMTTNFKIGQVIEIKGNDNVLDEAWYLATVEEIKSNNEIKVEFQHGLTDEEESSLWIDPFCEQIYISPIIQYDKHPIHLAGSVAPFPTSYGKSIIFSLNASDGNAGIHLYDPYKKEMKKIAKYPSDFNPDSHAIVVDSELHKIYLFGGETACFATFDLLSKTFDIDQASKIPRTSFMESYYCKCRKIIYFRYKTMHEYDINSKILQNIAWPAAGVESSYLVYDQERYRLLLLGHEDALGGHPSFNGIWIYDGLQREWKESDIKLPSTGSYDAVVGFDCIVFVIYFGNEFNGIWCLEMKSIKWYRSDFHFPRVFGSCDFVVTDDNYMHFIDYGGVHGRCNLYDIVPKGLFGYYETLIIGYIRMEFETSTKSELPEDLKIVIRKFYNSL